MPERLTVRITVENDQGQADTRLLTVSGFTSHPAQLATEIVNRLQQTLSMSRVQTGVITGVAPDFGPDHDPEGPTA